MNKLKLNIYIQGDGGRKREQRPPELKKEMAVGKERRLEKKRNVRNEF
jgi:hypothetical protein